MTYFDNGATSFPKPDVVYEEIMKAMKDYGANPGRSGHKLALKTNRGIYKTRQLVSQLFNIEDPLDLAFTFNATQGLNIGIKGFLKPGDHVITTAMEHNSVLRPIKNLEKIGVEYTIVKADLMGNIDPIHIKEAIKKNTKLIATTHVSNVTGTILPIEEIGKIAKENNISYLVDAAQSAGVYNIDVEKMNIDILVFPGHKGLLGPQGTGGLYIRKGLEVDGIFQGGTGSASDSIIHPTLSPDKFESGTLNAPGIIGLGAGVKYIMERGIDNIREYEESLTKLFIEEAQNIKNIKLYGPLDIKKQGGVVSLNLGNIDSSEISYILDEEYDIQVRPGMHCAPLAHKAIGTFEQGTVRFSFGLFNTKDEIEYALKSLKVISREI